MALSEEASRKLEAWKVTTRVTPMGAALVDVYEQQVERYFRAKKGGRNQFIVDASARLFYAVSEAVAIDLIMRFYVVNCCFFKDSPAQHLAETEAMLRNLAKSYPAKLDLKSAFWYERLKGDQKDAFRILRDLAMQERPKSPYRQFFISTRELGARLGCSHMKAKSILEIVEDVGLIRKRQIIGKRHARAANEFDWLFPLPPPPQKEAVAA